MREVKIEKDALYHRIASFFDYTDLPGFALEPVKDRSPSPTLLR